MVVDNLKDISSWRRDRRSPSESPYHGFTGAVSVVFWILQESPMLGSSEELENFFGVPLFAGLCPVVHIVMIESPSVLSQ